MDYNFLDVFKMKMVAGRSFSKEYPQDPDTSVILTESATRLLGYKKPADAVGKTLIIPDFGGFKPIIAGVVNDYHQVSLKKPIEPTIFLCSAYDGEYYSIRMNTNLVSQTLKSIERSWTKAFPGNPF